MRRLRATIPLLHGALLATLLVAAPLLGCRSGDPELVAVRLEVKPNTLDGCTACGCRAEGELSPRSEGRWWVSFGLLSPDAEGRWTKSAASSHCGRGVFDAVSSDFLRTVGIPYLILDLATTAEVLSSGDVDLSLNLGFRELSGFDGNGEPTYTHRTDERSFRFTGKADYALPLLVPDEDAAKAFAIHEVVLGLSATLLGGAPAAAYGAVSVSADVPGAEILLDGGPVGRVVEGKPTVLPNVLVGSREVRVRDFSGREAAREVTVREKHTSDVALEVLGIAHSDPEEGLIRLGVNPQGAEEYWRVRDRALVVRIPAGEFRMGSPDTDGEPDERPQRSVHVSEFLIDKTEVTWRQYRKLAETRGRPLPPTPLWGMPDDYPASFILWQEASDYCEWVGGRLPTEAEWEKAARGTDGRRYPWGDAWDASRCNSIAGGLHRPEGVGRYPDCLSPHGVLDMAGSMWEWCADRYAAAYYAESAARDPQGPASGGLRVMRGGAWISQPVWVRAAYRFEVSPVSRNADHGFRCAMDPPE